eukprot:CAMPEP_0179064534 /NCGR_PEP_ID=MMETSP0796-20121207/27997_1 /TAXON_ID=73915 /ORGANISM="Pyrodinium bahamense, Strain pbaha01" /LENGTH=507 /DNA_ID=CAMNT_0020761483 /DNA_START=46 /DNA_END=1566 /DNA_ORIENTATION=-
MFVQHGSAAACLCATAILACAASQSEGDCMAMVQTSSALAERNHLARPVNTTVNNLTGTNVRRLIVDWGSGVFSTAVLRLDQQNVSDEHVHATQVRDVPKLHRMRDRMFQVLPIIAVVLIVMRTSIARPAIKDIQPMKVLEMLAAWALFLGSGPAVILLNKHVMKEHHFHFPIFLASLGQLFIMVVTRTSVACGLYHLERPTMEWRRYLRVVLLLNIFNFGTQVLGMWSYMFVSVPLIQILKSITVVLVLVFAVIFVQEPVTFMLTVSILVISTGTAVSAVFDDGHGTLVGKGEGAWVLGVALCVLASAFEAAKTICSQILMDSLKVFDGMYWSSPAFVLLAVIFVGSIELRGLINHPWSGPLVGCLIGNALLTGLIVLSSFWFVKLVGALTLKIVTQARTVGLILVSVFCFSEHCSDMQYVGYAVTLVGMLLFNEAKQALANDSAKAKAMAVAKAAEADAPGVKAMATVAAKREERGAPRCGRWGQGGGAIWMGQQSALEMLAVSA